VSLRAATDGNVGKVPKADSDLSAENEIGSNVSSLFFVTQIYAAMSMEIARYGFLDEIEMKVRA
jgi:hypothetical protein